MLLTRFYDALLTVAYPQACRVCRESVERRRFGVACERCWQSTRIFSGAETMCWKCGELSLGIDVSEEVRREMRCHRCDEQAFTAARAVGRYENALRESVLELKRRPHVAPFLKELIVVAATREPLAVATKIVPVPLHERRLRQRGFNQASVIAEVLSKQLQLPLDQVGLLRTGTSEKYRAGLDPQGRRDTVAGAFVVKYPRLVENESVLLVDDVFTTGATVNACAEVLKASGARNVLVLTIARGKS